MHDGDHSYQGVQSDAWIKTAWWAGTSAAQLPVILPHPLHGTTSPI